MNGNAKSIRTKLLNVSKNECISFQMILIRYFQERLLFRLSKSEFRNTFCLKGGVLLYLFDKHRSRATKDIDLLAINTQNEIENLKTIFSKISKVECKHDAVVFDYQSIGAEQIIKQGNYNGVRLHLTAKLDTVVQRIQIDIGFGDIVYPNSLLVNYPVILEMEQPQIRVYSIYSAIAEKFEAMIQLSEFNSRMKDFYDVYTLLSDKQIDKLELEKAIQLTFKTRGTILSANHSVFQEHFCKNTERLVQWKAFLRKAKIDTEIHFEFVMDVIKKELEPIYLRMITES